MRMPRETRRRKQKLKKYSRGNGEENLKKYGVDEKRRGKSGKVENNLDIPTRESGKVEKKNYERKAVKGQLEMGSPCSPMAKREGQNRELIPIWLLSRSPRQVDVNTRTLKQTLFLGERIYIQDVDRKTGVLQDLGEALEGPYRVIRSEGPDKYGIRKVGAWQEHVYVWIMEK
ncbi:hypothetical protein JTB14_024782 [Gonioctena quinquepunctata]|nr:hypothetical protein JTB14_024782 [Gonioctena quinquepunctata]